MALTDYWEHVETRHQQEVVRGAHDSNCEWGPGFYLCNCAMRARVASGLVFVPDEPLEFPPPFCPHCGDETWHDGDGWRCDACHLQWSSDGTGAHFTDDHGDLSRCEEHGIRAHVVCQMRRGQ